MLYKDRRDAGQRLAPLLDKYASDQALVLALPRGGVVVGYEVAEHLQVPLEVQVVRKLGAPAQPEFGFGAIAPGNVRVIQDAVVNMLGLTPEQIERIVEAENRELQRRQSLYLAGRSELQLEGRTVILVDDGLATGVTARVAVKSIRAANARQIIVAVPVAPADTAAQFRTLADDFICPWIPSSFRAIGQFYEDFSQTTDQEVLMLLEANRRNRRRQDQQGEEGADHDREP